MTQFSKKTFLMCAIPISLYNVVMSSLGFVDSFMISQLGETEAAAAGIGARWLWFSAFFVSASSTGVAIIWNQQSERADTEYRRNIVRGSLIILGCALSFACLFFTIPEMLARLFSKDESILDLSSGYISLMAVVIILTGLTTIQDFAFRSLGRVNLVLYSYCFEVALNIFLNYLLIFGAYGAPKLGIEGAAIGSIIARGLRFLLLLFAMYGFEPRLKVGLREVYSSFNLEAYKKIYSLCWPVVLGSLAWVGGVFAFQVIYANMGTDVLVVMSIITPFELLALSFVSGVGQATSILVGKELGAQRFERAKHVAKLGLTFGVMSGGLAAFIIVGSSFWVIQYYEHLSESVVSMLSIMYPLTAITVMLKAVNSVQMAGILVSGGETKFVVKLDFVCQWIIAIPTAVALGLWLALPVHWVYLFVQMEEFAKLFPAMFRIRQHKWLVKLA
ncbi:putative Multi antimicrobial extrusion protein MatE [Vibrio nigripulchritudo SFn27]|nr:putative Multi antimicrobial extrusion protein MatE [Vibrio nigripulchritudo BLFn1]CCN90604.1 putative Multi antimicrobial extrusion protein MatE [Vibrio nigripulchritudo SFn27]CCN93459.1 putative Multi antimicrobial extrusion protein MatE [Vibrio nigripulchritudo ENn2]CCO41877.1 putative Multi antimicrobial extrusion protein MatE [Vibrio nigripulchritudo SFn135]CCO52012.1 putative Multi antimicrobial extrusion protein MatE [Vibrio nigripulchritudo Wn13]